MIVNMIDQNALCELLQVKNLESYVGTDIPMRYFEPWRGEIGAGAVLAFPSDIEQIRSLIFWAKKHSINLIPQGARTGLVNASIPSIEDGPNSAIVSLEKYKKNITFNIVEQKLIVDAGFLLSEINEYLLPFGFCLPVNVSSDPMVGAMAATNIGGSSVLRHGDFRDLTTGIKVVLADDEVSIYDSLDRPTKDNSSLNFTKLFCGSFGRLGIVTTIALKVIPIEVASDTYWIPISKSTNVSELVQNLEASSSDYLVACEIVSKNVLTATKKYFSDINSKILVPYSDNGVDVLFVEFATSNNEIDLVGLSQNLMSKLVEKGLVEDALNIDTKLTWEIRHSFSQAVKNSCRKLITCDISTSKDRFPSLRQEIHRAIAKKYPKLVICDFGHIGDGGIHMNIAVPRDLGEAEFSNDDSSNVRSLINEITHDYKGSFSAEHGLGELNMYFYDKYIPIIDKKLSQNIKNFCDPENVLGHPSIVFDTNE